MGGNVATNNLDNDNMIMTHIVTKSHHVEVSERWEYGNLAMVLT